MAGELPHNSREAAVNLHEAKTRRDVLMQQIPVDYFIQLYDVQHPLVIEALHEVPTLAYLLGTIEENPQIAINNQTGTRESVHRVLEGSGMFGLTNKEDAMRMRGIFNHIVGASRQKAALSDDLANMTTAQIEAFMAKGYDVASRFELHPLLQRDVGMVDHHGRRWTDGEKWYGWKNIYAPGKDSAETSRRLLHLQAAPMDLIGYLRFEDHKYLKSQYETYGFFPNLSDNASTVGDWTFAQDVVDIRERFEGLNTSGRQVPEILVNLMGCGVRFANDYEEIFGLSITQAMDTIPLQRWELKVRQAYCASSGLALEEVFPSFVTRYGNEPSIRAILTS